jgi:hypothetical protein
MNATSQIARLQQFKELLQEWRKAPTNELRSRINEEKHGVRREVLEAGCLKHMVIGPPPAVGGLVMNGVDPFDMIFNPPWGRSLIPVVEDMIDETIGVLRASGTGVASIIPSLNESITANYAFVAMPMNSDDAANEDVLDAIKEAGQRCGIQAERVDDVESNDRITDRVLESLRRAEFVIADLTNARPNVYYEAGYAHALGKTPIYVARAGTKLEFDLKDFPVIFFKNLKQLKDDLERRLRALAEARAKKPRVHLADRP